MRISQEVAQKIADKLTEKTKVRVEELKLAYRELVTSIYEASTPQAIQEVLVKYPDWVYTRMDISFTGHGHRYTKAMATRSVVANDGNYCNLELTAKSGAEISKALTKYEKAESEYKKLKEETLQALLALKTTKQIAENLPEAAPYLPPPVSNALIVNFGGLKKKLASQPEAKEAVIK